MINRILYIALCFFAISWVSCDRIFNSKKCEGGTAVHFGFVLPNSISPVKDTFNTGDTIWIESRFSDNMHNFLNDKKYKVAGYDFMTFLNLMNANTGLAVYEPTIIPVEGPIDKSSGAGGTNIYYRHDYSNGEYGFKIGWVVMHTGLYIFSFNSRASQRENTQRISECSAEQVEIHFATNNYAENNYHMAQHASYPSVKELSRADFEKGGCFFIYVK